MRQAIVISEQKERFLEQFLKSRSAEYIRIHERKRLAFWRPKYWTQTFYNRLLRFYKLEGWRVARGKKFAEDMRELVRGITAKTFLDIGCGQGDITGELLAILAEENPDIIGMGIDNKTEILKSKWKDNLAFWWGDIFDNEIPDASVDVIFAGYILQVLDAKGRMKLFDEIDRILAPGGTVIFLEVIDQGKKRNRVNELKHRVLNLFTPYLVMGEDEWVRYIERNGRGLIVWEKAKVGSRSKAFKARMKDY